MRQNRRCCEAHTAIDQGIRTQPYAPLLWCGAGAPAELHRIPLHSTERELLERALPLLQGAVDPTCVGDIQEQLRP